MNVRHQKAGANGLSPLLYSSGADAVVNLGALASTSTGSSNFSPGFDDALAVSPLGEENKERRQEHRANRTMRRGANGGSKPCDGDVEADQTKRDVEGDASEVPIACEREPEVGFSPARQTTVEHGSEGEHDKRREEPDGRVRPCGDFRPSLVGDHAGVAVVSHLLHVGLERAATTVGHHVGGVDEQLVALALNLGVEHHVFSSNAAFLKEIHFSEVGHAVSAVDAGVVGNGHQFALGLGAVAGAGGHEFGAEGHISALGTERVVVGGKVGPAHRTDFGVVEPADQFGDPIEGWDGVVVGEQHEVVVHLTEGVVAGVGPVSRRVVNPRGAVLFAHGFGVVLGFGVGDDELKVRVSLLAQSLEHDVELVGVVDGWNQHGRLVRRTVFFEQNERPWDRFDARP